MWEIEPLAVQRRHPCILRGLPEQGLIQVADPAQCTLIP